MGLSLCLYNIFMTDSAIAFFDFDGTITKNDTFISFARYVLGDIKFFFKLTAASPWIIAWKLGLITNSAAKEKFFGIMFRGIEHASFKEKGFSFSNIVDENLRPDTIALMQEHRNKGHKIVIVSASIREWIEPWAQKHGIDNVISTGVELDCNNKLTGRFSTPNCHGLEKVNRILQQFSNVSEIETYAYGDSDGDDAMLSIVSHPHKI